MHGCFRCSRYLRLYVSNQETKKWRCADPRLSDLDTFNTTVVETTPAWTQEQFEAYAMVMDQFSKYDNVAGFYIGSTLNFKSTIKLHHADTTSADEIINTVGDATMAAPYIKVEQITRHG